MIRLVGKTVDDERTQIIRPHLVAAPGTRAEVVTFPVADGNESIADGDEQGEGGQGEDGQGEGGQGEDGQGGNEQDADGRGETGSAGQGAKTGQGAVTGPGAEEAGPGAGSGSGAKAKNGSSVSIADAEAPNFAEDPTGRIVSPDLRVAEASGPRAKNILNSERPPDEISEDTTHIPAQRTPGDDE
ncbi:hypothetical protein [Paractinoplanes durhamensis]|uniref:hypothetical protein n=1 Tax=Paractinoplanes durhamensis TaxID=113563 RepID=UPI00363C5B6A